MSEHTEWKIKWSHHDGITIGTDEDILLDVLIVSIEFEEAQRIAEQIVREHNAHKDLLTACEAWMKVESESKTSNPCPDYTLRTLYRKEAVKLSEAAIAKCR